MGDPAKVTKLPEKTTKPDLTKPMSLKYWALPNGQHFGNQTTRLAQVGLDFTDGNGTSGRCTEILAYPSGAVTIEVQPHQLTAKDDRPPKRYVVIMGVAHGSTLHDDELEALIARGQI